MFKIKYFLQTSLIFVNFTIEFEVNFFKLFYCTHWSNNNNFSGQKDEWVFQYRTFKNITLGKPAEFLKKLHPSNLYQ